MHGSYIILMKNELLIMHVYIFKYQKSGPYDFYSQSESIRIRGSDHHLHQCSLKMLFSAIAL